MVDKRNFLLEIGVEELPASLIPSIFEETKSHFLEKFKETYDILNENIKNLEFKEESKSILADSFMYLEKLSEENMRFDIIFVDPPYLNEMVKSSIDLIVKYNLLKEEGVLVSKYDISEDIYLGKLGLKLKDKRKYGKTYLGFYQYD